MPSSLNSPARAGATTSSWGSVKLRLALMGALLIASSVALTVGLTLRTVDLHSEQVALDLSLAQTRKMAKLISARLVSLQLALRSASEGLDTHHPLDATQALALLRARPVLASLFDSVFVSRPDGQVVAFRDGQGVRTPSHFSGRSIVRHVCAAGLRWSSCSITRPRISGQARFTSLMACARITASG